MAARRRTLFAQTYERLFSAGGYNAALDTDTNWNELFLLKVNVHFLDKQFVNRSNEELIGLKDAINTISHQCILALEDSYEVRNVNAIVTLGSLIRNIFSRDYGGFNIDVLDVLFGRVSGERLMQLSASLQVVLFDFSFSILLEHFPKTTNLPIPPSPLPPSLQRRYLKI